MASSVLENCTFINDRDGMKRAEALENNESLFTFLLEESQDEGCSAELLNSIVQSLEAEINHTTTAEVHDYDIEMLSNDGNSNGQMCRIEEDGHGWHWNNSLLECADQLELAPCPMGQDMDLYMDTHGGDEMSDLLEFENLIDYVNVYNEQLINIEGQGCSSLWQQTWAMTQ